MREREKKRGRRREEGRLIWRFLEGKIRLLKHLEINYIKPRVENKA